MDERDILVLAVHPPLQVRSMRQLIAFAKARPGDNFRARSPAAAAPTSP